MKKTPIVVALALIVGIVLGVVVFDRGDDDTQLTSEMRREFGAACFVPADSSAFSSSRNILPRLKALRQSQAVRRIMNLPLVQGGLLQLQLNPRYQEFRHRLSTHPLAVQGRPVLEDALSTEVIVWAGPEFPQVCRSLNRVLNSARLADLRQKLNPDTNPFDDVVATLLAEKDNLRLPTLVMGFNLQNPKAAKAFLDEWMSTLKKQMPDRVERERIGGEKYFVVRGNGAEIPDPVLRDIAQKFTNGEELIAWLKTRQGAVAVGVEGDWMLLSFGSDVKHLAEWGQGPSLAESDAFEPLRQHFKPGIIELQYLSKPMVGLTQLTQQDLEDAKELINGMLDEIPETQNLKRLRKQLKTDLDKLAEDLSQFIARPTDQIRFSISNQGWETYVLEKPAGQPQRPLDILAHRGNNPITVSANNPKPGVEAYDLLVDWMKIMHGYFEEYALPELTPDERQNYEQARDMAVPFLQQVDRANRQSLFPALGGGQNLLVLDGNGELRKFMIAGEPTTLASPLPIPRLGLAFEIQDVQALKHGMAEYQVAFRQLLDRLRNHPQAPAELKNLALPKMLLTETPQGTLVHCRWPWDLEQDIFPCALLQNDLLVLATSKRLAHDMARQSKPMANHVLDLKGDTIMISQFRFDELWNYLEQLEIAIFANLEQQGVIDSANRGPVNLARSHIDTVLGSLKAIRGYTCTVRETDGMTIRHSWTEIRDID